MNSILSPKVKKLVLGTRVKWFIFMWWIHTRTSLLETTCQEKWLTCEQLLGLIMYTFHLKLRKPTWFFFLRPNAHDISFLFWSQAKIYMYRKMLYGIKMSYLFLSRFSRVFHKAVQLYYSIQETNGDDISESSRFQCICPIIFIHGISQFPLFNFPILNHWLESP